ncbi:MAG: RNA polymerase sigma factor [Planctomycetota bacterium]
MPEPRLTPAAFADLFAQHAPMFRVVAASRVGLDAADDVLQRAAILALGKLDSFTPETNFRAWFSAFVRNEARNMARSERRRTGLPLDDAALGAANPPPAMTGEPDADSDRLQTCLDGLSNTHRECVLLRVLSGCSYTQIAQITGLNSATARSHVHRARSALAACMGTLAAEGAIS